MDIQLPTKWKDGSSFAPCPTQEAFDAAAKVVNDYVLRLYQLLYAVGLTSPSAGPTPQRWQARLGGLPGRMAGIGHWLEAVGMDYQKNEIVVRGKTPEEVFNKVALVEEAKVAGKRHTNSKACCLLAEVVPCVCSISFSCPVHGTQCHGSHD